jgi:hypothetical protein
MTLKKERVVLGIGHSMLHGFTNIIGLNIVSRMISYFALYASCSKGGGGGRKVLLLIVDVEIGIEMMH